MVGRLNYPPNVFISYSRTRKISSDQKMPYSSQFRWKFDCRPKFFLLETLQTPKTSQMVGRHHLQSHQVKKHQKVLQQWHGGVIYANFTPKYWIYMQMGNFALSYVMVGL